MKFNPDTVHEILREYQEASLRLRELGGLSHSELIKDPHKIASAKYHFIIVIEAAIDLCNHLIAKNNLRVPEDYADTFKVMAENDMLPADFVNTLKKMAGFRNRLVHRYWDIDTEQLHSILTEYLGDLDRFLTEIHSGMAN